MLRMLVVNTRGRPAQLLVLVERVHNRSGRRCSCCSGGRGLMMVVGVVVAVEGRGMLAGVRMVVADLVMMVMMVGHRGRGCRRMVDEVSRSRGMLAGGAELIRARPIQLTVVSILVIAGC